MRPATAPLLDAFGGLQSQAEEVARFWRSWDDVDQACRRAAEELERARRDEAFLRQSVDELANLEPTPGEIAQLTEDRALLKHRERLAQTVEDARSALIGEGAQAGADQAVARALQRLESVAQLAAGRCDEALAALERADAELNEAVAALQSFLSDMAQTDGNLEAVEDRYFALLELARKHHCEADALPERLHQLQEQLALLDVGEGDLRRLSAEREQAWQDYLQAAETLSQARQVAGRRLDAAIAEELPPLKLEKARFATTLERLPESAWGAVGLDRVAFQVATLPGQAPGPIAKIASGGELARFLLALKVVLAAEAEPRTDPGVRRGRCNGIGGATAHAVGERLARLADRPPGAGGDPQPAGRGARRPPLAGEPDAGWPSRGVPW